MKRAILVGPASLEDFKLAISKCMSDLKTFLLEESLKKVQIEAKNVIEQNKKLKKENEELFNKYKSWKKRQKTCEMEIENLHCI